MELTTLSVVTLKRNEREIGPGFEKPSKRSTLPYLRGRLLDREEVCDSALVNETILNAQTDEQGIAELTVGYDRSWQRRSI